MLCILPFFYVYTPLQNSPVWLWVLQTVKVSSLHLWLIICCMFNIVHFNTTNTFVSRQQLLLLPFITDLSFLALALTFIEKNSKWITSNKRESSDIRNISDLEPYFFTMLQECVTSISKSVLWLFCCQGDQGPIGPPGRPGDNGDPVSITCTSTEVASNCKYTLRKKRCKAVTGMVPWSTNA